jgi:hypothetical protein
MSIVPSDEQIYIDFEDEEKSEACCAKMKTSEIDKWIAAHKEFYGEGAGIDWEDKQSQIQMRIKSARTCQLVVKFFPATGVILAQSKEFQVWADHDVPEMKHVLGNKCDKDVSNQTDPMETLCKTLCTSTDKPAKSTSSLKINDETDLTCEETSCKTLYVSTEQQTAPVSTSGEPCRQNDIDILTTKIQALEDNIFTVIQRYQNDVHEAKLNAAKADASKWKKIYEEKCKELANYKNASNTQSTSANHTPQLAECEKCAVNKGILAETLIQNEELEKKLSSCMHNLTASKQIITTNDRDLEKLYSKQNELTKELEIATNKIRDLQRELNTEHEKHTEWCMQMDKQMEERISQQLEVITSRQNKSYAAATAATSKETPDHVVGTRSRAVYHISDIICVQGREDPLSIFFQMKNPMVEDDIHFPTLEHLYQYRLLLHHGKDLAAQAAAEWLILVKQNTMLKNMSRSMMRPGPRNEKL